MWLCGRTTLTRLDTMCILIADTDTILIVSKKKYGRDKAVGYIFRRRRRPTLVVRIRGSSLRLFSRENVRVGLDDDDDDDDARSRAFSLSLSLSVSVCVCVFFDVFCASRGPLFVTPFPVSSFSWGKSRRETHIFHACVWGGVTCRRHISSRSPRNRPRTSSASNRTNWLPFYLRRAVLSPLSKSPSRLVPNTFSRF